MRRLDQIADESLHPLPARHVTVELGDVPVIFGRPTREEPSCRYCENPVGDECDCLSRWGNCVVCDAWAWLQGEHCGECYCATCEGGPRQLAHPHCQKHGACKPPFCSDRCADAWAADGEALP